MELKRILARDNRAASEEAMAKYGRDVLIVSSNRVNGQAELIVAVDVQTQNNATSRQTPAPAPRNDGEEFASILARQATPTERTETSSWSQTGSFTVTNTEQALSQQHDSLRGSEIMQLLKQELTAIRQEMRVHQQLSRLPSSALPPALGPLLDELVERGLPPGLREHITHAWQHLSDPIEALGVLESELCRLLPPAQPPVPWQGVHALVGPSGAGKSLACAKLARLASDSVGADKVAWISYADIKAGAWSQTQMLAAASGVSALRAANAEGLQLLLDELSHMRLVLIDTAGAAFEQHARQVRSCAPESHIHVVLPLDATLTSIKRTLHDLDGYTSVILSKADETYAPWPMLHGLSRSQARVSLLNTSERVHTAMQPYTPSVLTELAMNTLATLDGPAGESDTPWIGNDPLEMHEVPDLTSTLEPFADALDEPYPSISPSPEVETALPVAQPPKARAKRTRRPKAIPDSATTTEPAPREGAVATPVRAKRTSQTKQSSRAKAVN
jgi:flagellar biosynthesis protein FlhF